jgi:hypothetical protein
VRRRSGKLGPEDDVGKPGHSSEEPEGGKGTKNKNNSTSSTEGNSTCKDLEKRKSSEQSMKEKHPENEPTLGVVSFLMKRGLCPQGSQDHYLRHSQPFLVHHNQLAGI